MNMGHNADFDNAVKSANGKLSDPGVSSRHLDIRRAGHSGSPPDPAARTERTVWEIKEDEDMNRNTTHATPQAWIHMICRAAKLRQSHQTLLWEEDCWVDLRLLNIRITRRTLQLIPANLAYTKTRKEMKFVSSTVPPNGESGDGV